MSFTVDWEKGWWHLHDTFTSLRYKLTHLESSLKQFDTINHDIFLAKSKHYGITVCVLSALFVCVCFLLSPPPPLLPSVFACGLGLQLQQSHTPELHRLTNSHYITLVSTSLWHQIVLSLLVTHQCSFIVTYLMCLGVFLVSSVLFGGFWLMLFVLAWCADFASVFPLSLQSSASIVFHSSHMLPTTSL